MIPVIKLTDNEKEKLLFIAKTLFPEYSDIHMFVNGHEYSRDMQYIAFSNDSNDYYEIHWAEFLFCVVSNKWCLKIDCFKIGEELESVLDDVIEAIEYDN